MPRTLGGRIVALALLAVIVAAGAGCSSVGYYAQAAQGHLQMMAAARPIDDWLQDPAAPEPLRTRLALAREMRAFAARELGLPDNRSYTAYADLKRPAVVWNVFATPELSLTLKTWCYPLFGCAGYRGYFDQAAAQRTGDALKAQGYDVNVAPVPAYSTLGWTNWLGGDPLLNTFIQWPEAELARLIFHELAHQVLYVKDDTAFNESFATAVERAGVRRWIDRRGDAALAQAYAHYEQRRADFLGLLLEHRAQLAAVFTAPGDDATKRAGKRAVFEQLQAAYQRMKAERWGGFTGYDRFFNRDLNTAHLAAIGAYNDWVPAFEALLQREGGDLPRFYAATARIADLPKAERDAALRALAPLPATRHAAAGG
jgi:predicted aminopeptidase